MANQKRVEFPRFEYRRDGHGYREHEIGRAELDQLLAAGWRVVHLTSAGGAFCAIVEPPSVPFERPAPTSIPGDWA